MDGPQMTSDGRADRCAVLGEHMRCLLRESSVFAAFVWSEIILEEYMEEYKKVTISFTKDQLEKLDEILKHEQGYTRSSLVREAVDNYIGYRVQKESVSYLSPIISQNISPCVRFVEDRRESIRQNHLLRFWAFVATCEW